MRITANGNKAEAKLAELYHAASEYFRQLEEQEVSNVASEYLRQITAERQGN